MAGAGPREPMATAPHAAVPSRRFATRDLIHAWLVATVFSGAPSTFYALATGGDPMEATRAAGAMLVPADSPHWRLLVAAVVVHCAVSGFWTGVFGFLLPRRRIVSWALAASAVVAWLDLRIVAPQWFPSVAALPFWPQFADHLMWGALLGWTLRHRLSRARCLRG